MEDLYYKKVFLSTGEVPEDGHYDTNLGYLTLKNKKWWRGIEIKYPDWWLKPSSISPKKEAVEFADDLAKNAKPIINGDIVSWSLNINKTEEGILTSELYDRRKNFKEGR